MWESRWRCPRTTQVLRRIWVFIQIQIYLQVDTHQELRLGLQDQTPRLLKPGISPATDEVRGCDSSYPSEIGTDAQTITLPIATLRYAQLLVDTYIDTLPIMIATLGYARLLRTVTYYRAGRLPHQQGLCEASKRDGVLLCFISTDAGGL